MGKKQSFGIFDPQYELVQNIPNVIISKVLLPDSQNVLHKDGKIIRRPMREKNLVTSEAVKVRTPDENPILEFHTFVKRSTGLQYLLGFTKAHIYCWNWDNRTWDLKFICSADCVNWEVKSYNDKVMATNNVDPVLVWDTTGYFMPLQNTTPTTITAATKENPCHITAAGHNLTTGDRVFIKDAGGMIEINNLQFVVTVDSVDVFSLDGIDSSGYTVYTTGGTVVEFQGIEYSRSYSTETEIDETSAADQKVLKVVDTIGFSVNDKVIIDREGDREEIGVVDSVQAGISLTLKGNLTYEHTANALTTVDEDSPPKRNITGASKANPCQITAVGHGYSTGIWVWIEDIGGMVELLDQYYKITKVDDNNFTLDGINSTGYSTYTSGGTCSNKSILYVASTTGFSVSEIVTINKDGDREEKRRIDSIQENVSLTMTVILSYEHTQVQGDEVVGSLGQEDKVEEYISYYLTKAKHLTTYENFLILGYPYENGNYYPQRFRWNAIGNEDEWIATNSGSTEVGKSDILKGFGQYQGLLIVYKASSYYKYWLTADTVLVFNGLFISKTIGCRCSKSIVNDDKGRLYWYASDGTFKEISTGTISQPIQTKIVDLIYQTSVENMRSNFIDETGEVCWAVPVDNVSNNKLLIFKEGSWGKVDMAVSAFGGYQEP